MSSRPRVLLLAQRFPPDIGGLAQSAARMAASLARAGAEVEVIAWTRALPPGMLDTLTGERLPAPLAGVTLHRLGLFHSWDLSLQHSANVLEWMHRERRFQLLWGHYLYPPGFLAAFMAARLGIASVVSARGNDVDRMMFPPGDFARLVWTLERASLVTAVSRDLADKIGVLTGHRDRVLTLPNVVDTRLFHPRSPDADLRAALGIAENEAVLGFSGELRHKKGMVFLLEALRAVRTERPACLLVVGEVRTREEEHLSRFAAEHPEDAARVIVTGHLDDPSEVARHQSLCDLFVMPSLWDGMPNALLEAMSAGLCVLVSDAGGMPEVVRHGETGFIVPRAELHRLGEAAREILALAPEARRAVGESARRYVEEHLHLEAESAALSEVLARLATPSSS